MSKLTALLMIPLLAGGCEMIQTVPSARGRVIDAASGQPVVHAVVVRTSDSASKKKITNAHGEFNFRGKWRLQVALGDTIRTPCSYLIEANGYCSFETNRFLTGFANEGSVVDDLGPIPIVAK